MYSKNLQKITKFVCLKKLNLLFFDKDLIKFDCEFSKINYSRHEIRFYKIYFTRFYYENNAAIFKNLQNKEVITTSFFYIEF